MALKETLIPMQTPKKTSKPTRNVYTFNKKLKQNFLHCHLNAKLLEARKTLDSQKKLLKFS